MLFCVLIDSKSTFIFALIYILLSRLELCQVEVELGQYLGLRQELEQDEKTFQSMKKEKHNQRLEREKSITKRAKLKALRAKKYTCSEY